MLPKMSCLMDQVIIGNRISRLGTDLLNIAPGEMEALRRYQLQLQEGRGSRTRHGQDTQAHLMTSMHYEGFTITSYTERQNHLHESSLTSPPSWDSQSTSSLEDLSLSRGTPRSTPWSTVGTPSGSSAELLGNSFDEGVDLNEDYRRECVQQRLKEILGIGQGHGEFHDSNGRQERGAQETMVLYDLPMFSRPTEGYEASVDKWNAQPLRTFSPGEGKATEQRRARLNSFGVPGGQSVVLPGLSDLLKSIVSKM